MQFVVTIGLFRYRFSITTLGKPSHLDDKTNKSEYLYDYQDYSVLAHIHNFSLDTLSLVFKNFGFDLIKGNEYVRSVFGKKVPKSQR